MKALSVQQPWAWLLTNIDPKTGKAYKPVENRSWFSSYVGELLIHAGKTFDREGYEWIRRAFPEIPLPEPAEFERGGIVGRTTMTDCVTSHPSPLFFGPYGFVMEDGQQLPFFPVRGQLGFFDVDMEGTCQP